ncbi:MFS transporter [Deinococcus deserti]|uniref:Putative Major facilitator superfamily MFS-1 n=1 Tax=Deinococcus deserti (strain DSM 17065 / CIP 109153 / LMG 22923 / VCD115) TaxID=546414 RepID=C1CZT5_DEIDV|nr:MFS transporter [Deinococcus deserti]ACO45187.1 putative Major facilitator superfamily MFS-1 [Deinococcus deserti VCD115]
MAFSGREIPLHVVGAVAFAVQGMYISLYGPIYPRLLEHFDLTQAQVGWIAGVSFLGSSSAMLGATWLMGYFGVRRMLSISLLHVGIGAVGVGFSPGWTLALLSALVAGLGIGGVSSAINVSLASLPERSAPVLNMVNAMFGLGCVLGPLLVAALSSGTTRWPFVVVGLLAFVVLVCARGLPRTAPTTAPRDTVPRAKRGITLFTLLLFLYVMTEVGAASWMTTHLAPQLGARNAAALVSGFWLAFMLGRFAGAPLTAKFPPQVLVPAAAVLAIGAAALTSLPDLRVAAYMLLGLVLAPVFPTTVAWYGQHLTPRRLPIAMTGGTMGAVAIQPLMGLAVSSSSVSAIPVVLLVLAGCVLAVSIWIRMFQGARGAPQAGAR